MGRISRRFSLWRRTRKARRPRRSKGASRSSKAPILIIAVIAIAVFLIGNYYISNHLRPIITQMARVEVNQLAATTINQAIIKRITDENVTYGDLVYFEKDVYGQITALKTDIIATNRLRADISSEVLASLKRADTSKLAIPAGNLINSDLFSGRGPKIPIKIVPLGTVSTSFSNQFTAAGINQTRHQIMMDIVVDISILLPGYQTGTQVTTQVTIAETVIVGAVPDSYFQMQDLFSKT
ncbi:MAG: sporulation protein YunB [Oscillospiraceae bacterium]|nr:sporulation protein YunB [Oscillospiraceae bacterium]